MITGIFTGNYCMEIRDIGLKALWCMARPARFERATAWFVASLKPLSYQLFALSNYRDFGLFRHYLSTTCGILQGCPTPRRTGVEL